MVGPVAPGLEHVGQGVLGQRHPRAGAQRAVQAQGGEQVALGFAQVTGGRCQPAQVVRGGAHERAVAQAAHQVRPRRQGGPHLGDRGRVAPLAGGERGLDVLVELGEVALAGVAQEGHHQGVLAQGLGHLPGGGHRRTGGGAGEDGLLLGHLEHRPVGRLVVDGDDVVELHHRETKKNGDFGKCKALALRRGEIDRWPLAEDRAALALLLGNDPTDRYSYGYGYGAYSEEVIGAKLSPKLHEEVLPRLAATTGLLVVDVDPEVALRRVVEQRGMREDDVRARMGRQATREQRLARADRVIDNNGTLEDLESEVKALVQTILSI